MKNRKPSRQNPRRLIPYRRTTAIKKKSPKMAPIIAFFSTLLVVVFLYLGGSIHYKSITNHTSSSKTSHILKITVDKSFPSVIKRKDRFSSRSVEPDPTVFTENDRFSFHSGTMFDEAYELALSEVNQNIENGIFIAGAGWDQLWTRDTSYAVELAAGLVNPTISKISLEACVEHDEEFGKVWLQDTCGNFGGWPNLSDAIVGAQGAWAYYVITGDTNFLNEAYKITKNSLMRAGRDVYDEESGLFMGCSSFMESNSGYSTKYAWNGELVGKTKALSTNMLYYNGFMLGGEMGKELGAPPEEIHDLRANASRLRNAIRSRLWHSTNGYYSYLEDETNNLLTQMEGLGESLVLLSPGFEDDNARIESIFKNTPRTRNGIPCSWPPFDIKEDFNETYTYYHNGRIWPFVQGYWAMAAARHNKPEIFYDEFHKLLILSQQNNTFHEFYEIDGNFVQERSRQLWSDTGFLSMVYHGLFGMKFLTSGIEFKPVKMASYFPEKVSLENVIYRKMTLDIYVLGSGSYIKSFKLDDNIADAFLPKELLGRHKIEIVLKEEM